jgi:hypothetical protein
MLMFIAAMTLTFVSCSQNDVPSVPVTLEQPDPEPAPQPEISEDFSLDDILAEFK